MNKYKVIRRMAMFLAAAVLTAGSAVTVWASTRLETVSDPYWDDDNTSFAVWDEVEDAYQYEVYLYCNESKVAEFKTKKVRLNMESKMTREGDYTFRVRALAKKSDDDFRDGYWSDYSDETYIDASYAEMVKNGGRIDNTNSGPGSDGQGTGTTAVVSNTSVVYAAKWIQNDKGWWYQQSDGTYPSNGWFQDPATSKWYFMDANGYMMTGWIDWNGQKYYCGSDGAMYQGENTVDGTYYTFDNSGALLGG